MKYLSIDIGTTGGKTALFSENMELLSCWRRDYPTYLEQNGIVAEQDSKDWWLIARDGISAVLQEAGVSKDEVGGIGLSCMTPVLLPVDKKGVPLCRAWVWYDRRAIGKMPEIYKKMSCEEQIQITGSSCKEVTFLNKLLFFRDEMPHLYEKTAGFLQASGYLVNRMTGRICLDSSHGELLMLTNKEDGKYSEKICAAFSLDKEKLPEIIPSDEIAGRLTEEAAGILGLPVGTPVISGGHDSALSTYALGAEHPGEACLDIGNAANLIMCTRTSVSCLASDTYRHPLKGKWLFQIYSATIGAAFRWYKNCFGLAEIQKAVGNGTSVYDELCDTAKQSQPGAEGLLFLPYLQGAQQAAGATGAFLHIGLGSVHADFVRALLEGCAYSIRYNMEQMEEASGMEIKELVVCGGGSQNRFWLQIYADILKKPLVVSLVKEAALTGAAMLAQKAVEKTDFVRKSSVQERILPNPDQAVVYGSGYKRFKKALEQQIFGKL